MSIQKAHASIAPYEGEYAGGLTCSFLIAPYMYERYYDRFLLKLIFELAKR